MHTFAEIDRVQDFQLVALFQQQPAAFHDDAALRVLSIRIEKKVNYFYEVSGRFTNATLLVGDGNGCCRQMVHLHCFG